MRNGSAFPRWALIGTVTVALLVAGTFLRWDKIHVILPAEEIGNFGGFVLTNTILVGFLAVVVAIGFVARALRNPTLVPGRSQGLVEIMSKASSTCAFR